MLPDLKGLSYLGALAYFHDAAESLSFLRATQALNAVGASTDFTEHGEVLTNPIWFWRRRVTDGASPSAFSLF